MSADIIVIASRYSTYGYGFVGSGGISEQPEANGIFLNPTLTGDGGGGLRWQGIAEKLGLAVVEAIVNDLVEKGINSLFGPSEQEVVNTDFSHKADSDPARQVVTLNNGMPAVKFSDGSYYIDRNRDGMMDLKLTQIGDDVYVDYGDGDGYQRLKAMP